MLCQFLLYSKVIQFYIYIHSYTYILFLNIISHHGLPQEIGYSSLCCTVGPYCLFFFFFFFFLFFGLFLGPCLWHMEVPQARGQIGAAVAYATATATAAWDPSCIFELHHSSQQCWILNPLSKARDGTRSLTDTSPVCYC